MTDEQYANNEQNLCITDDSVTESADAIYNPEAEEFFLNIKSDLGQVDRLVSEAVTNLVINFKFISQLTKSHYEMVMAIEKLAIPDGSEPIIELLRKQMMIADKIEHELEAAVTSLQFGDLVTQLLAHTSNQIDVFNRVLQRIDRHSSWQSKDKNMTDLHDSISKAIQITRPRSKQKPVVQQAMHKGEVELF